MFRTSTYERCWSITAHHEAGHAVAAVVLDLPLDHVQVGVQMPFFGEPVVHGETVDRRAPRRREFDDFVVSLAAGGVAEYAWYLDTGGYDLDVIAEAVHRNTETDRAFAEYYHDRGAIDLATAEPRAADVIRDCWDAVLAVVDGLAHCSDYLTGSQVAQLVAAA